MLSNRVKRNIWLVFAILSFAVVVTRSIDYYFGETEGWKLFSSIIITVVCTKFYLDSRRKVNG